MHIPQHYFKESLQLQRNEKFLTSSSKHFLSSPFHLQKFLTAIFSHFLAFYISTVQNGPFTTAEAISFSSFTQLNISSTFFGFHLSFPLSHFQIYNCNCTVAILLLQITTAEIVISCALKYAL